MSKRQLLEQLLANMPEDRLQQLLEFAEFLVQRSDDRDWAAWGKRQFARAYADDEPEYTLADGSC